MSEVSIARWVWVALGGALGAVSRDLVVGWVTRLQVTRLHSSPFPYGTLTVNVVGSFLLGLLMGFGIAGRESWPSSPRLFLGIGFLGAFTTFSTFSWETLQALRLGDYRSAMGNVLFSVLLALFACGAGFALGNLGAFGGSRQ